MSRCNTVKAVVIHGRTFPSLRTRLGFTHKTSPAQSTYTRLFQKLKIKPVRQAVVDWLESLALARLNRRKAGVAVDGKSLRGTGHHMLNVFIHDYWMLLDQLEVGQKDNEMSAFRDGLESFLARYPFIRILTFDALFCEQKTMETLTRNNRMGIFQVKENQPEGLFRIQRWFARGLNSAPGHRSVEKKRGLRNDP